MRDGWDTTKFGDVCTLDRMHNRGVALPYVGLEDIIGGTGEFVGSKEPKKVQSSTFRFTPDHILYGRLRPYLNKVFLPDFSGHCSTEIFPIRPTPNVDRRYLFYWLTMEATVREIDLTSTGARMPRANVEAILEFPIPLPPLAEQQHVAAILDEAFAGLATATANAEKNLKNARELFESYLNSVFAKKGADWTESRIGEICTLQSGTTVDKRIERTKGDVPYLKVADMNFEGNEERIFSSSRFLNRNDIKTGSIFPVGTTIFPKRGGAILTNKKRLTAVPICADLNIMGILPSERIQPELVFMYFLAVDMRQLGSGSSIPQINNYDVAPLPIHFPQDKGDQKNVVDEFEQYQAAVRGLEDAYRKKLVGLSELKQAILHKAFSGELTSPPSRAIKEAAE